MPRTRETWVPDQENHWVSILPPPAISGSCFLVYRKRPVMLYCFYIGVHLKSSAALLTEDSSAILQLKYDLLYFWSCLSKMFHNSVYCSFLKHYYVGHMYKTFNITFFSLSAIHEHLVLHKIFRTNPEHPCVRHNSSGMRLSPALTGLAWGSW